MAGKIFSAAARQPHFWIALVAVFLGFLLAAGVFPVDSEGMRIAIAVQSFLAYLGYQQGMTWSPPRKPWTDQERVAHGLPPADRPWETKPTETTPTDPAKGQPPKP
jgi:hypothetical protein